MDMSNMALLACLFTNVGTHISEISQDEAGSYIFHLKALDEDIHKFFRAYRAFTKQFPNQPDKDLASGVFRKEFRNGGIPQWYYVSHEPALELKFYQKCYELGYLGGKDSETN